MRRRFLKNKINKYYGKYFSVEVMEGYGNIGLSFSKNLEYCTERSTTWNTLISNQVLEIQEGDVVKFRADLHKSSNDIKFGIGKFTITGNGYCSLFGNIMSLLYKTGFSNKLNIEAWDNIFNELFSYNTCIVDAANLILPATTLSNNCYCEMFRDCTNLQSSPELPAKILKSKCYYGMLMNTNVLPDCSNIDFSDVEIVTSGGLAGLFMYTKITDDIVESLLPKNNQGKYYLPVLTLSNNCYDSMFKGCTNLTVAPELPATTLANNCYSNMFSECTNLTVAPELPATTLAGGCYSYMFSGCTNLIVAPELPATTLANTCYSYMFSGCRSIVTSPQLRSEILRGGCYVSLFENCTSLSHITATIKEVTSKDDLLNWVNNVSERGVFIKYPDVINFQAGITIPNNWIVKNYGEEDLIVFYLSNTDYNVEYSAEEGMTWEDWVNSEYNIIGAYIDSTSDLIYLSDSSTIGEATRSSTIDRYVYKVKLNNTI